MLGKLLFALVSLSLVHCARPKYIQEADAGGTIPEQQRKLSEGECAIRMNVSGNCFTWYWETKPTSKQPGSLIFKTFRLNVLDKSPVEVDMAVLPEVVLWMPSMGHGSSPTKTQRIDVGTYRATSVFFIMPGAWEIKFQIKENNNLVDGVVVAVSI